MANILYIAKFDYGGKFEFTVCYLITTVRVVFYRCSSFVVIFLIPIRILEKFGIHLLTGKSNCIRIPSEFLKEKVDDRGIAYCRQNLDSVKSCAKQTKLILNPLAFFIRTFMKPYKNKTYRPAFYTKASLTWPNPRSLNSSSTTQWDI